MSLALRFGGLAALPAPTAGAIALVVPRMPRLPKITDLFPQLAAPQSKQFETLEDLKKHMENGGNPPFAIDNGLILRAVPKKRPSHRRTREKLYAPGDKQIQHLDNLGRCPACGHVKRSHFMCMHCFAEIRAFLKEKKRALLGEVSKPQADLDPIDEKIIYPGKYVRENQLRKQQKDWIPKREEPLMFDPTQVKK